MPGEAARRDWRLWAWAGLVGVTALLAFVVRQGVGLPEDFRYSYSTVLVGVVSNAITLGIVVLIAGERRRYAVHRTGAGRPQHHRSRDRRHDRHRDLLDDRGRRRRSRRPAGCVRNLARLRRSRDPRERRQPGRAGGPPRGTPLRAEAAAEPAGDAGALSRTAPQRGTTRVWQSATT